MGRCKVLITGDDNNVVVPQPQVMAGAGAQAATGTRRTPVAFISSTSEDLTEYRVRARDAAIRAGFTPRMMEYFGARGEHAPLEACMKKITGSETVEPADVVIAIVAQRYGWVPKDQPGADRKSITWLECEQARKCGKEVLAILVDEKYEWPVELREDYRINQALLKGQATAELLAEVQSNMAGLNEFKACLNDQGLRAVFTTPESLYGEVLDALYKWRERNAEFRLTAAELAEPAGDPRGYLESLRDQTSHIDIRGLIVGSGRAPQLRIEELYIPLKTTLAEFAEGKEKLRDPAEGRGAARVELHEALKHRVLLIVGDPGSGKTTFLKRVAYLLCESLLGSRPDVAKAQLGLADNPLPMLIRLADLVQHVTEARARHAGPTSSESPGWLAHFMAVQSKDAKTGLNEAYFEKQLAEGAAMVLLDGLDEAPSHEERVRMANLFDAAARAYKRCRFVLTSRPVAFRDDLVMPHAVQVQIDDLEENAIETFLKRWCQALFVTSPGEAEAHCRELTGALRARPEIRKLARNPVMLTALAVVHWNEKRIPEQRADLYESILMWLARARQQDKQRPKRVPPERCINLHQELALAMQDHPRGRQVQVPRFEAAQTLAPQWRDLPEDEARAAAEAFLVEEELDSGIIVSRGNQVRSWHLTFQEYLAARALAGRKEEEQRQRLLLQKKLYQPEWRETVLLLGGVLHRQAISRVDAMVSSILDSLGDHAQLRDQARCLGILGAAVHDLAPVAYKPSDARYASLQEVVLGIFDRDRSQTVEIRVAIEAAEALGQAGDPRFAHGAQNWIEIPAGEFLMGSQKKDRSKPNYDPEAEDDETPVRKVHLNAYKIGRYPVTVGEYQRFVDDGGYGEEQYWREGEFGKYEKPDKWQEQLEFPNRPVIYVSWHEAAAYALWAGCRLPTEAEWERAARGTDGRKYPWGNDKPNERLLNYAPEWKPNVGQPTPVGVYPRGASPEGVEDMAGNVLEWCGDWYGPYSKGNGVNPTGPEKPGEEERRVFRGGSWNFEAQRCRSSFRFRYLPSLRDSYIGFRLVVLSARTL